MVRQTLVEEKGRGLQLTPQQERDAAKESQQNMEQETLNLKPNSHS